MSGSISSSGPTTFGYSGAAVQATVATAGDYYIAAFGAQGGTEAYVGGGGGAEIGGEFSLTANEGLTIAVGGQGGGARIGGGGGGGESFVVGLSNMPLVIAGGGGGGSIDGASDPGQTGTSGSTPLGGGAGGTNGAGGAGGNGFHAGGGGGGFLGSGGSNTGVGGAGGGGGYPGLAGGAAANNLADSVAAGGFGGGGGSDHFGGGGGGGYSGGGGGVYTGSVGTGGGGGGGSYDASTSHTLLVAGENGGNGYVFIAPVDTPTIAGTVANQSTASAAAIDPFSGISISDPNLGTLPETVTLTPSTTANGTLSDPNAATDHSSISNGVYTVAGTAAQVQADLRGLVFTAATNQSGQPVTTGFTVGASNVAGRTATDGTTSVVVSSAALPSTIKGTQAGQATTDEAAIQPFAAVSIADTNGGNPTETVTVTPSTTANGVLSDPSAAMDGGSISNGVYTVSGSASAVTAALDGLVFTPLAHEVQPGQKVTTGFTIMDVNSASQTTTDSNTSLVATAVNDAPTLTNPVLHDTVAEGQTLQNLYGQILANTSDPDVGAKITIQSIGQSGTMGVAYLDPAHQLLTYTADGYNPANPTDSFTYAVANGSGPATTGMVDLTITPSASLPTQAGTAGNDTLTASKSNTRLIGGYGNDTLNANAAGTLVFAGHGDDTMKVNAAKAVVYGGPGTNTINLGNTAQDSIVLQQGGVDQISGFNLHNGDHLDLRQVLAESQLNLGGDFSKLASYVQVTDSGNNATLSFNQNGVSSGSGSALAVLHGVGANTTLNTLINDGSLRIS